MILALFLAVPKASLVPDHGMHNGLLISCQVFSCSKNLTAVAVALLVDRGLLSYSDTVAHHWPEFGQHGKAAITVRSRKVKAAHCTLHTAHCRLRTCCGTRRG